MAKEAQPTLRRYHARVCSLVSLVAIAGAFGWSVYAATRVRVSSGTADTPESVPRLQGVLGGLETTGPTAYKVSWGWGYTEAYLIGPTSESAVAGFANSNKDTLHVYDGEAIQLDGGRRETITRIGQELGLTERVSELTWDDEDRYIWGDLPGSKFLFMFFDRETETFLANIVGGGR